MNYNSNKWDKFLLGEAEQQDIDKFLDRLSRVSPSEAPFDNIFKGKWRIVAPYGPKEYEHLNQIWYGLPDDYNIFFQGPLANWPDDPSGWMVIKGKDKELHEKRRLVLDKNYRQAIEDVRNEGDLGPEPSLSRISDWVSRNWDDPKSKAFKKATAQYFNHKKRGPREIKLGKIINREFKDRPELVKTWNDKASSWNKDEDAFTAARDTGKYSMIVSRHPVDVYRMSDHLGISSCHSLDSSHGHCAIREAEDFGMIAYVVETKELRGLDLDADEVFFDSARKTATYRGIEPLARRRLRRYLHKDDNYDLAIPDTAEYGRQKNGMPGFLNFLTDWSRTAQEQIVYGKDDQINKPEITDFIRMGGSYEDAPDEELFNRMFKVKDYIGKPAFKDDYGKIIDPSLWHQKPPRDWRESVNDSIIDFRRNIAPEHLFNLNTISSPGLYLDLQAGFAQMSPQIDFNFNGALKIVFSVNALTDKGKALLADTTDTTERLMSLSGAPAEEYSGPALDDQAADVFVFGLPTLEVGHAETNIGKKGTFRIKISFDTTGYNKDPDGFKEMKNEMIKDYPVMLESTENLIQQWKDNDIIGTDEVKEQTEPFQKKVKARHKGMKVRLIGKGKGKHVAGSYKEKPSYKRSKSAPPAG